MKVDNPYCKNADGKSVYQSGNDSNNPNGFKQYFINGYEVWAYNYKDARIRYKVGLVFR
jgi:hypothetical protein